ncbi:MAG TPA: SPOR domain-containing protein [Gammaproteobacteria bacterium]|nr:SPOR domain-containing protein [Gammaproteobacteria bacterium]
MAKSNRSTRRKDPAPGWAWMLLGLALGLVVAGGVYLRGASPSKPRAASGESPSAASKPPAASRQPSTQASRAARAGDAAKSDEPRFDFYETLPKYEVVIPEVETAASPAVRAKPIEEPGSYVLQAGSFGAAADAERLKANLALLGIESRVQRVTIDDDTYHRVRIGPITDLNALNRIRKQLRDARIEPMVMKVP